MEHIRCRSSSFALRIHRFLGTIWWLPNDCPISWFSGTKRSTFLELASSLMMVSHRERNPGFAAPGSSKGEPSRHFESWNMREVQRGCFGKSWCDLKKAKGWPNQDNWCRQSFEAKVVRPFHKFESKPQRSKCHCRNQCRRKQRGSNFCMRSSCRPWWTP